MDRFTGAYKLCDYCEDEFYTLQYNKLSCSDECRKEMKNKWQRVWQLKAYHRNKAKQ